MIHDSMLCDLIQGEGQGHEGLKVAKMTSFHRYACNQKTNGEL